MKAFAYTETYSGTAHSNGPVTFYTLRYTLLSALKSGAAEITTTDEGKFREVLAEARKEGVMVVRHRLPLSVRRLCDIMIEYDVPKPFKATISRYPIDESVYFHEINEELLLTSGLHSQPIWESDEHYQQRIANANYLDETTKKALIDESRRTGSVMKHVPETGPKVTDHQVHDMTSMMGED